MESIHRRCLFCCLLMVILYTSQTYSMQPAAMDVRNRAMKSNAITTAQKSSQVLREKRQVTGSRISWDEAQSLVVKHNIRRRNETASDMQIMKWNDELASMAQDWADACYWGHGQPARENPPFPQIGQNLYAYEGTLDLERAMAAWSEDEKQFYNYVTLECVAGEKCGHYTQIVWATSNEVGCAYHTCPGYLTNTNLFGATYLVCNYGPAGNYRGEKPFKMGPSCTECESGKGWCDNGLCRADCSEQSQNCECKVQCHNCGIVNNDCTCSCSEGFYGPNCKDRCLDLHEYCGANPGWPVSWCSHAENGAYVTKQCPATCGTCIRFDEVQHGLKESCPVASADPCFDYPENFCSRNGRVSYRDTSCICVCNAGFKGFRCEEMDQAPTPAPVNPTNAPVPEVCAAIGWYSGLCQNGGSVVYDQQRGTCMCSCTPGWTPDSYCTVAVAVTEKPPTTTTVSNPDTLPEKCKEPNFLEAWCQNGGSVIYVKENEWCACACAPGWTNYWCDVPLEMTAKPPTTTIPSTLPEKCREPNFYEAWCQNAGRVIYMKDTDQCACTCMSEWTGSYCELPLETTTKSTASTTSPILLPEKCREPNFYEAWCQNAGTVIYMKDTDQCACTCMSEWTGSYCHIPVQTEQSTSAKPATTTPVPPTTTATTNAVKEQCHAAGFYIDWCQNGATAVYIPAINWCSCTCSQGFSGYYCDDVLAIETSPKPSPLAPTTLYPLPEQCQTWLREWCQNDGVVDVDSNGLCMCKCQPGWTGKYCSDATIVTTQRPSPVPSSISTSIMPKSTKDTFTSTALPATVKSTLFPSSSKAPTTTTMSPEKVTEAEIGVILDFSSTTEIIWNKVWSEIQPQLKDEVNRYCGRNPETCCDGADIRSTSLPADYSVEVGEGYPDANETYISVLLFSTGTEANKCGPKELPQEVFYELVMNMHNNLDLSVTYCCQASLVKAEKAVPESVDEDSSDGIPLWGYILAGAVGFVVVVLLICLVICCVRRKNDSKGTGFYEGETGRTNLAYQK